MKKCTYCKEEKSLKEFSWKNKSKNKKASECKKCHRLMRNNYYLNNKDEEIERVKTYKNKIVKWFEDFKKTLSCKECGESHPATLQFHHINPEEKEHAISVCVYTLKYSKLRLLKEIEKCEILCANCHSIHHYNERNGIF